LSLVNTLNSSKYIFKKLLFTFRNFKKTAYHYYGNSPLSLLRFVYYSFFRVNTFLVFENDLRGEVPEIELDPKMKVLMPALEELDRVRKGKDLPREFFYDQIHNVKTCLLGFYGGEIAYIHWIYFKGDYSRFLILGEGVCEINYLTTLPKFRGKKLSSMMLAYASKSLQKAGYKKIVVVVHQNNIAFIKNVRRLAFKETRHIKTLGPFNRKIIV
jgi:GNAT superfamily N-acetyltransferase